MVMSEKNCLNEDRSLMREDAAVHPNQSLLRGTG